MSIKKIIAIVILVVGLIAIGYAVYNMKRLANARGTIQSVEKLAGPYGQKPVGKMIGNAVDARLHKYDQQVMLLLIGGIVLAVVGGGILIIDRKR